MHVIPLQVLKVTGQRNPKELPSLACVYAKTWLIGCIRAKEEASDPNQIPSNQITAINQSPFLSAYQTAHLLSSVTLHHTHSSDAYCRIIHVLSVWLPQRAEKKESLALSDRFYCGNERRSLSFFFFLLVHLPLLRCCLAQQTKLCKEAKKVWLQMHLVEKSKMRSEMFSSLDVISIL